MSERTRARRRRWMAWSVLPSLLAVVTATTALGRIREVDRAADRYADALADHQRAPAAVAAYESLAWPSWFDEDVGPLGLGAAALLAGDLAGARAAFEDALERSSGDRRCRAVVDLVLTIEAQGDEISELDPAAARAEYLDALRQIDTDPACRRRRRPDGEGAGDRLDRAVERLEAKLLTAPPGPSDQRPVSPEQTESEPDQSDLDDLDRALDENADTRSQGPELEEGGADIGARPPHVPQW